MTFAININQSKARLKFDYMFAYNGANYWNKWFWYRLQTKHSIKCLHVDLLFVLLANVCAIIFDGSRLLNLILRFWLLNIDGLRVPNMQSNRRRFCNKSISSFVQFKAFLRHICSTVNGLMNMTVYTIKTSDFNRSVLE